MPSRILLSCLLMARVEAGSAWTVLLPGFVVAGIGVGIANPVIASVSVAVVPAQRSGMASGSSNTFRQVGIATGIAGLGAVFQSQAESYTLHKLASSAVGRLVLVRGDGDWARRSPRAPCGRWPEASLRLLPAGWRAGALGSGGRAGPALVVEHRLLGEPGGPESHPEAAARPGVSVGSEPFPADAKATGRNVWME